MSKSILGIDIGTDSIKLVELTKGHGSVQLVNCVTIDIDLDSKEVGAESFSLIAEKIKNTLRELNLKAPQLIFSISGQSVFSRFVKLPMVDQTKIFQIVRYEAQQQVPFPLEEVIWDYQVLKSPNQHQLFVALVAIKHEVINFFLDQLSLHNLEADIVDVSSLSLYNCYHFNYGDLETPSTIINIGAKNTDLILQSEGVVWTRSLSVAGDTFTQTIMREAKISSKEALTLKEKHCDLLSNDTKGTDPKDLANTAVKKVANRIVAEISRSIGFYQTQFHSTEIKDVYITGGSSLIKNIDKYLNNKLQLNVHILDPLNAITVPEELKKTAEEKKPFISSAVGLALRKLSKPPISVNILPKSYTAQKKMAKKKGYIILFCIITLLMVITLTGATSQLTNSLNAKLDSLDSSVKELETFDSIIEEILSENKKIQFEIDKINDLVEARSYWLKTLLELEKITPDNIWITKFSIGASPDIETKKSIITITVNGETNGLYRDIIGFRDSLNKSSLVKEAIIESASTPVDNIRTFVLKITLSTLIKNQ